MRTLINLIADLVMPLIGLLTVFIVYVFTMIVFTPCYACLIARDPQIWLI